MPPLVTVRDWSSMPAPPPDAIDEHRARRADIDVDGADRDRARAVARERGDEALGRACRSKSTESQFSPEKLAESTVLCSDA